MSGSMSYIIISLLCKSLHNQRATHSAWNGRSLIFFFPTMPQGKMHENNPHVPSTETQRFIISLRCDCIHDLPLPTQTKHTTLALPASCMSLLPCTRGTVLLRLHQKDRWFIINTVGIFRFAMCVCLHTDVVLTVFSLYVSAWFWKLVAYRLRGCDLSSRYHFLMFALALAYF